jgi:hypothetical protein
VAGKKGRGAIKAAEPVAFSGALGRAAACWRAGDLIPMQILYPALRPGKEIVFFSSAGPFSLPLLASFEACGIAALPLSDLYLKPDEPLFSIQQVGGQTGVRRSTRSNFHASRYIVISTRLDRLECFFCFFSLAGLGSPIPCFLATFRLQNFFETDE